MPSDREPASPRRTVSISTAASERRPAIAGALPLVGYGKRKLARSLLIATKLDVYRRREPGPVAERYFEAARRLDTQPDGGPPEFCLGPGAKDRAEQWLAARGLAAQRVVALAPGAAHATKRWPVAHWSALAERLAAAAVPARRGGRVEDRGLAQQLVGEGAEGESVASAAGEFSLQETGALLARARVVVSGRYRCHCTWPPALVHRGRAVRTHGRAVRLLSLPRAGRVLERALDCRPCSATGTASCPLGHHRCLADITPEEVAATVEHLARDRARRRQRSA